MNKVISSVLSIFAFLVGFLFLISLLLSSEKSLKFLLNLNQDSHVDFVLAESYWHPYKPSIEFDTLSIKRPQQKNQFLKINNLKIEFNILTALQGKLIESIYADKLELLIYPSSVKVNSNLEDLWLYVSSIENIRIKEFSLTDSENLNALNGVLSLISLDSGDSKLQFSARNISGGNLEFRMNSILGSESLRDYKGFLSTSSFSLNKEIVSTICSVCPSGVLDGQIWFTVIDLKLVRFLGGLVFKPNLNSDFINSINARIELEDSDNKIFRISSFINDIPANRVPEIFTSISSEEVLFYIPEIELGNDIFANKFLNLSDLPKDLEVEGSISNLILDLHESIKIKTNFDGLSLSSKEFSITGLAGNLNYTPEVSRLKIKTPYLKIDFGNLFDNPLVLNDLSSELDLNFIDGKVYVSNSNFKGSYKQTSIEGNINLYPSPVDDSSDISLKMSSSNLDYLDALNLFPNLISTNSTKSWLKNSISCGSLEEVSFIYRGPVSNKSDYSSSSFQSKGFFDDACIKINNVAFEGINLFSKINNSSYLGEILDGEFYGSEIKGSVKAFKDSNSYILQLKGKSEGPLFSILKISNLDQIFEVKPQESGEHYTNFQFISPLSSNIELLGVNSNLKLTTKIKKGNFTNNRTNLTFSDLYSSIEYDSLNGVKDGFATLKINNVPVKLDISKGKEKGYFNTKLIAQEIFSTKKLLSSFNIKSEIKGASAFTLEVTLPSFVVKQPLINPEIKVLSNLDGISINLPEPFNKSKDSEVDLSLVLKLFVNEAPSLKFVYGDLFRGKFTFKNNLTEGFIIAGKKKQNISTSNGKILLVGELQKVDLGSLISSGVFDGEGYGNFFIKDLLVKETNLSNLSLSETRFKSSRTEDGIEYKFVNKDLSGLLLVPSIDNKNLSLKFDFIEFNQSSGGSKDNFLSLYNGIKDKFDFSADKIVYNGQNYGNWKFSILPENNKLILYDINGTYGRWGLKQTKEGISSLVISKNSIGWTSSLKTNIYSGSPEKAMMQIGIKPNFELDTISLDTNLTWSDLPWLFNFNSIEGEVYTNLNGLTIKNSENLETANNLLRLVNIFNITDSFEKVTNLDFRKLYKRGFNADSVSGVFRITNENLEIKKPIVVKSGSSQFSWTGKISRDKKGNLDNLNLEVIMTLPLREYLPAYALVLGGPITAGVVYIAGKAFERNLDKVSSGKWIIEGNISEPKTEFDGWFEESNE